MLTQLRTVTTTLVHKRENTAVPWWHGAVICDLPGSYDNEDLDRVAKLLPDIATLGFDAVLLRPADPRVDVGLTNLPAFIDAANVLGLKVLVRAFLTDSERPLHPEQTPPLLPLQHDVDSLSEMAQAILGANADGVDLGMVNDELGSPDGAANAKAFTQAVQAQLAEVELAGKDAILSAAIRWEPQDLAQRHLTEDWFHHLRDDLLVKAPWDAQAIQGRVGSAYEARDPLGHSAAWRYSLPKWTSFPGTRNSADYGWADAKNSERRERAMLLFTLSLPGAVYVPFLHVGGGIKAVGGKNPGLKFNFRKGRQARRDADLAANAIRLRARSDMSTSTLAFVTGQPWANKDTCVHTNGSIMVVLNTGSEPLVLPSENRPMISSRTTATNELGETVVKPDSCTWFKVTPPQSRGPKAY